MLSKDSRHGDYGECGGCSGGWLTVSQGLILD